MTRSLVTEKNIAKIKKLNEIAKSRNQSLSQMALVWTLKQKCVVSAIIGASNVQQIEENVNSLKNGEFTLTELKKIENILSS